MVAKYLQFCEIFAMHSENPAIPAFLPASSLASIFSIQLDISSSRLDEITENSYEHGVNRHQHEAKLGMMGEVSKTC